MIRGRFARLPALLLLLSACSNTRGTIPTTRPLRAPIIARPLEVYQQLGFMAGPADYPVVASLATLAGPHDSTYVLLALSLPNSALRFQRDSSGFVGQYHIAASFMRDSVVIKRIDRLENVRVASFAETSRTDESIIFQDITALAPGKYTVQVQSNDAFSSRGFRARDSVEVPAYGRDLKVSAPVLVYSGGGRSSPDARPDLIVNARRTVPYGADPPRVYVELYGASTPRDVQIRIVGESGAVVWQQPTTVAQGDAHLRFALVEVPTATLPLGRLWVEATIEGTTPALSRGPLIVTISDQWMVANFEEVLRFVNYIALPLEVDSLRLVSGSERRERWERFWARRDPLPATQLNEFREEFFSRVRFATEHFSESGRPGWDTQRGEVYIVLGAPDQVTERQIGRDAAGVPNAIEWFYENTAGGRLQLLFIDRGGFGHFQLTPQSEQTFRAAAFQARPKSAR